MGNAHVWGPELVQPLEALGWVTVYAQAEATRARTTATVRMVEVVEEREKKEGKKKERRWVPTEEDWAGEVLVGKMQTSFLSGVEIPRGYAIFTSYLVTGKFSPPCSSFLAKASPHSSGFPCPFTNFLLDSSILLKNSTIRSGPRKYALLPTQQLPALRILSGNRIRETNNAQPPFP